jgi:hypothetical protein
MPQYLASRCRLRRNTPPRSNLNLVRLGQGNRKVWTFSTSRKFEDRAFFVERQKLQAAGDLLDVFLSDNDVESVACLKIKDFCRTWNLSVSSGQTPFPKNDLPQKQAWADIQPCRGGASHSFPLFLEHEKLRDVLKEVRFIPPII